LEVIALHVEEEEAEPQNIQDLTYLTFLPLTLTLTLTLILIEPQNI